jgi:hypothetical protein
MDGPWDRWLFLLISYCVIGLEIKMLVCCIHCEALLDGARQLEAGST